MTTSLQDIIICSRTCRLLPKDLDVTDKQAMESTLRLFDIGTDHNGNKTRVSMFRSALELEEEEEEEDDPTVACGCIRK